MIKKKKIPHKRRINSLGVEGVKKVSQQKGLKKAQSKENIHEYKEKVSNRKKRIKKGQADSLQRNNKQVSLAGTKDHKEK